jgi:hypothetical protein
MARRRVWSLRESPLKRECHTLFARAKGVTIIIIIITIIIMPVIEWLWICGDCDILSRAPSSNNTAYDEEEAGVVVCLLHSSREEATAGCCFEEEAGVLVCLFVALVEREEATADCWLLLQWATAAERKQGSDHYVRAPYERECPRATKKATKK